MEAKKNPVRNDQMAKAFAPALEKAYSNGKGHAGLREVIARALQKRGL